MKRDTIGFISGLLGIFVFLTGIPSLPALLGYTPSATGNLLESDVPRSISLSAILIIAAVFLGSLYAVFAFVCLRFIKPGNAFPGAIILFVVLLLVGAALEIMLFEALFGPVEKTDPDTRGIFFGPFSLCVFFALVLAYAKVPWEQGHRSVPDK